MKRWLFSSPSPEDENSCSVALATDVKPMVPVRKKIWEATGSYIIMRFYDLEILPFHFEDRYRGSDLFSKGGKVGMLGEKDT